MWYGRDRRRPEQGDSLDNTSGWRRVRANRQVRLGGNEGGRDRGAPWKPVALEGGGRQSCSVAVDRAGTRSIVGRFGEKCRDRKRTARLQHGGLRIKAAANRIKRSLLPTMDGIASLGCTVAEAYDTNWEGGGRFRGLLGGGTGIYSGRLSASQPLSQVGNKGRAPAFFGLGTNVHGWSLPIPGRSRASCGVVVSLKMSALGDVGNYSTCR